MPYRRLPNTDSARIRALRAALAMSKKLNIPVLAFSPGTLQKLDFFLPHFEQAIKDQRNSLSEQTKGSGKYSQHLRQARLYVSHFIQVLNFAIIRGELKPEIREFYGIAKGDKTVPSLVHDIEVLEWGAKVIDGEQKRTMKGGNPVYSPSIALVRVHYEKFKQFYNIQKNLQRNTLRCTKRVAELRKEADRIILSIWNEVEANFASLDDDTWREKCREYGVVYVYRKDEERYRQKKKGKTKDMFFLPFPATIEEENQPSR